MWAEQRWPRWLAAVLGLALWVVVLAQADDEKPTVLAMGAVVPIGFLLAGLIAWSQRPANRTGLLMVASAFALLIPAVGMTSPEPLLFTAGVVLSDLFLAPAAHLVAAYPSGYLPRGRARHLVVAAYVYVLVVTPATAPALEGTLLCGTCEPEQNLLYVEGADLEAYATVLRTAITLPLLLLVGGMFVQRWRRASGPARRVYAPVLVSGIAATVLLVVLNALYATVGLTDDSPVTKAVWYAFDVSVAALPFAFLLGLLRTRVTRSTIGQLVEALARMPGSGTLRDHLAHAVGDPSLQVAYWSKETGGYVNAEGRPVDLPDERGRTEIAAEGRRLAVLIHDPALHEDHGLVDAAAGAARLALERESLQADLRARVEAVRESRARIVRAGDAERRRIERNLHDGAQQRLVALSLSLRMLGSRARKAGEAEWAERFGAAFDEAQAAVADLRRLAQGLHPSILSEAGLGAAVRSLADEGAAVEVDDRLDGRRFGEAVELAAYLAVAALVGAAGGARVELTAADDALIVTVGADGVADPAALAPLADRLETVGARVVRDGRLTRLVVPAAAAAQGDSTGATAVAQPDEEVRLAVR